MTEVFERSGSSSSETDSYTSDEDESYTVTEEEESEKSGEEEEESMIVKEDVVTATETKYENASVVLQRQAVDNPDKSFNIPPPISFRDGYEPSTSAIHPTLDGQQLMWKSTIFSQQGQPNAETEQTVTIIKKDSNTSSLEGKDVSNYPTVTQTIMSEEVGVSKTDQLTTNLGPEVSEDYSTNKVATNSATNSRLIYENMSKSYVETSRGRYTSESSSNSSYSESRVFDQKTYVLEKPTIPLRQKGVDPVDDHDPAYGIVHPKQEKVIRNPTLETVEFDGSERNIDFEIEKRRPTPYNPYNTILDLEIGEDDVQGKELPNGVRPIAAGVKPIAAGVKASRPSIAEKPDYKPESDPVYSVVNRKKIAHSNDSILRPYIDDRKYDAPRMAQEREPRKANKKKPLKLPFFGKTKDKKLDLKRQISGPVGQLVHYSGQSDATQIKSLGVGIYREGARTGVHPNEEIRPPGNVEIVDYASGRSDGVEISDPTLYQTMFVDIGKGGSESEPQPVKPIKKPKRVKIVTYKKEKNNHDSDSDPTLHQSMFCDVEVKQKPTPPPLLEPTYELEPPQRFQDTKPVKQEKPPRKVMRTISKEDIGLPIGTVVHEKGKSSPELMDAFGIEVKGRISPELQESKPKTIKSNRTIVRTDSILDLNEGLGQRTRRSSEPEISTSEEDDGRKKRSRDRRSRRKGSPSDSCRRIVKTKVEEQPPAVEPTLQSRNNAYMELVYSEIPGLENVEPAVLEKYVKALISLPTEQNRPRQQPPRRQSLDIRPNQDPPKDMFDANTIEQFISHMQNQQKQRNILAGELDFFDPRVLRKYRKLTTKNSENKIRPLTEKEIRRKSQDVFNQRRVSIGQFLANSDNKRRSESFTYLPMTEKGGPWYKEEGQQDKGMTATDLLEGRRLRHTPKKDPRFPNYHKRLPVQRSHSTSALNAHLKSRPLLNPTRNLEDRRESASAKPERYRKLLKTPEEMTVDVPHSSLMI